MGRAANRKLVKRALKPLDRQQALKHYTRFKPRLKTLMTLIQMGDSSIQLADNGDAYQGTSIGR